MEENNHPPTKLALSLHRSTSRETNRHANPVTLPNWPSDRPASFAIAFRRRLRKPCSPSYFLLCRIASPSSASPNSLAAATFSAALPCSSFVSRHSQPAVPPRSSRFYFYFHFCSKVTASWPCPGFSRRPLADRQSHGDRRHSYLLASCHLHLPT